MKSDKNSNQGITEDKGNLTDMRTKIIRNREQIDLSDAIRQEIISFQKNNGSIGLHQSVLIIDHNKIAHSQVELEECANCLGKYAPGWTVQTLTKTTQNGPAAIFNLVSKSTMIKAIAQTGLITIPSLKSKLFGLSGFLLSMVIFFASLMVTGYRIPPSATAVIIAFFCAAFLGYIIYRITLSRVISKFTIPASVIETLKRPDKGTSFKECFSSIANNVCNELPLVIIIEDASLADPISVNVLKQVISFNQISYTGAILWIAFNSGAGNAEDIFNNCSVPVKRYAIKDEEL